MEEGTAPNHELSPHAGAGSSRESYRLYPVDAIATATFLGSLVAGSFLVAANYRRLGRPDAARNVVIVGLGLFLAFVVAIVSADLDAVPDQVFHLLQVGVVAGFANWQQGRTIADHVRSGGEVHSKWRAAGIGILALPATLGLFVLASFLSVHETDVGPLQDVRYERGATEQQAQRLRGALEEIGLFRSGTGATVVLAGTPSEGFVVSFVVQEDRWNDEVYVTAFRTVRKYLADGVFAGSGVEIWLCDSSLERKRAIEPIEIDSDLVVHAAAFGVLESRGEKSVFVGTSAVPRFDGQRFGPVITVESTRDLIHWRVESVHRAIEGDPPESFTTVTEIESRPEDGEISHFWTVGAQDPIGERRLAVYVEDQHVATFVYRLDEATGRDDFVFRE